MKTLEQLATDSATERHHGDYSRDAYRDGYITGVLDSIDMLSKLPEYFDARDHLQWRMGATREQVVEHIKKKYRK